MLIVDRHQRPEKRLRIDQGKLQEIMLTFDIGPEPG
jgi:hypothetical protein